MPGKRIREPIRTKTSVFGQCLASRSWANSVASSRSLPSKMSSKQTDLCVALTLEKGKGTTNLSQEFSFAAQLNSNDRKRIGALAKRATRRAPDFCFIARPSRPVRRNAGVMTFTHDANQFPYGPGASPVALNHEPRVFPPIRKGFPARHRPCWR